jgi:hypothetical protein
MKPIGALGRRGAAVLFVLFFSIASAPSQTRKGASTNFQLGDQIITIPDPNGFEEAASQFDSIKERFTSTEAPGNDMLAVHLRQADIARLRAGDFPLFNFYTKISMRSANRDVDFSGQDFAQLVARMRKDGSRIFDPNSPSMKETLEKINKSLTELNREETQVGLSQPVNLGEFDSRQNVYSLMLLLNFTSEIGAKKTTTHIVGSLSYVLVKQKLLYVYTYRKYESQADTVVVRDFARRWIGQILAAN